MWILTEDKKLINTDQVSKFHLKSNVGMAMYVYALMSNGDDILLEGCDDITRAESKIENLRCFLKGIKVEDILKESWFDE